MFLTRECDYAVRIIRSLSSMEVMPVRIICENEDIPLPFAYKILKKLEKAQFVKAYRGATGGYQLRVEPASINLLSIVSVMDKGLYINECLQEGFECKNHQPGKQCKVHIELERVQEMLTNALKEKTMNDLV